MPPADSGRSPFRRAESFFPLLTPEGEIAPPLILWINRDSFMAGALLFFPGSGRTGNEAANRLRRSHRHAAFRHLGTARNRHLGNPRWPGQTVQKLPLPATETSSAEFCQIFLVLLEELKQLSITGAVPPSGSLPFYFANLCRLAYQSAMPVIAEAYRIARAENRESPLLAPATAPEQQGYLLLLRLLALLV